MEKKKSNFFLPTTWHGSAPKVIKVRKRMIKRPKKNYDFTDFVSQTNVSETWYYHVFEALIGYPPRGLNPSPSSQQTGAPQLSYRDQLGWKSIHITLLSDSWWFSVSLIKLLSDISTLSYIRDTFVPWIKGYYDEGYSKDVVLGCLTDF